MNTIVLTGEQMMWITVASVAGVVVVLCTILIAFRGNEVFLKSIVSKEFLVLRVLTVLFVVWATTALSMSGQMGKAQTTNKTVSTRRTKNSLLTIDFKKTSLPRNAITIVQRTITTPATDATVIHIICSPVNTMVFTITSSGAAWSVSQSTGWGG